MLLVGDPGTGERTRGQRRLQPEQQLTVLSHPPQVAREAGVRQVCTALSFPSRTGKSQFQKYVAKLAPRAVVTSGRASSAVSPCCCYHCPPLLPLCAYCVATARACGNHKIAAITRLAARCRWASPRRRCTMARGGAWRRAPWCWRMEGCAASTSLTASRRRTGGWAGAEGKQGGRTC